MLPTTQQRHSPQGVHRSHGWFHQTFLQHSQKEVALVTVNKSYDPPRIGIDHHNRTSLSEPDEIRIFVNHSLR